FRIRATQCAGAGPVIAAMGVGGAGNYCEPDEEFFRFDAVLSGARPRGDRLSSVFQHSALCGDLAGTGMGEVGIRGFAAGDILSVPGHVMEHADLALLFFLPSDQHGTAGVYDAEIDDAYIAERRSNLAGNTLL